MIYYAKQNNNKIRLLQTSDNKKYKLSALRTDEGDIKAIVNFPFFSSYGVVGRYQGDEFNNTVDQSNFDGDNIVILEDGSYKIGKFNSWDYQNGVLAGFCPSAVIYKGKDIEISKTITDQKQFSMTAKINRTAIAYDKEFYFFVGEKVDVKTFIAEIEKVIPNYDFIALGDSGGSSELIIDGKIQNKLSDGKERPNYCGLAFLELKKEEVEPIEPKGKLFIPRLSKDGMKNNPYWYDNSINAGAKDGLYLPNCVTYASGRLSEETGHNMRNIMSNRDGFGNAKEWYKNTKLDKGSTPKEGAIACFDGTLGHVAIVERINKDGSVLVSQSNYEQKKNYDSPNYFQTRTYKLEVGKKTEGVGLTFLGYIYAPYIRGAVSKDDFKQQVEIIADKLRVRKTPNGDWRLGLFAPLGLYDVLDVQKVGDYNWAKLDDDVWVALNDKEGWTKSYLTINNTDYEKEYRELVKRYSKLEDEYNILSLKHANLSSKVEKLEEMISKVKEIVSE